MRPPQKAPNMAHANHGLPSFSSFGCNTMESPLDFMALISTLIDPADAGRSLQIKTQSNKLPTTVMQASCQHSLIQGRVHTHTHNTHSHIRELIVFVKVETLAAVIFHGSGSSHAHPIDEHKTVELAHAVWNLGDLAVLDGEAK